MKGLKIAVIGGGSSYTPELIDGFIKRANELPVNEIYLVDIMDGKHKLEIVGELAKRMIKKSGLSTKIISTLDRRTAIKGADFVMTQFRVGGLKARARDERIPLRYNVLGQETTGPGGFAKAMRTIPVIMDICKDIEELSPSAWLINFTNPAGMITETILKHTNVKTIGLCNVPIGMVKMVANILDVDSAKVKIDFVGLNHLVWGSKVYVNGENVINRVIDKLCDGASLTMKNIPDLKWDKDFLKSLKMIPCPYHRYYYMTDDLVAEEIESSNSEKGTRAEQVQKIEKSLFEIYKNPDLDIKPPQLEKRGGAYYSDAAVSLISAIYNDKREIHTVNVRNNGTIPSLPHDVAVEVNCVVDSTGPKPITVGYLPAKIKGLIQSVKAYEELAVQAGITGNYGTALQALTVHPLVPSVKIAKQLLDDIIRENREYLPQFK
ncbi:6-phospho-beta-glucosidase [Paramaledivibacter caminithermalis]|uniref:6-phospho-beta-glucosidase n=1 Tax=Paramaledivibacter caminithermalis (strain DSM 15212 / CIP 107654 / DViRD3) TaxID=1121301 RepID=A0A1M6T6P6_PARC5|nr:6-phospho-beta-glucosidase [Paramaledivibacter caminithermalis]SHK52539.1 6-phospho-beta-glucosidase [Paramaledivibacter caminithermalis DSM 15212]